MLKRRGSFWFCSFMFGRIVRRKGISRLRGDTSEALFGQIPPVRLDFSKRHVPM